MLLIQTMCCGLGGGVYKKGRGWVSGYMGDRVREGYVCIGDGI